ncbi:MAG: His/Gly/Thr/Pro-type tRNA ligase C-terminal domain-containing protein [Candidatus Gracilibacteria bacterium]
MWLSYYPVAIIPVVSVHEKYAEKIKQELWEQGIRSQVYAATDTLGKRIREAELKKTPYMLVVGDKEVAEETVTLRDYATKKQAVLKKNDFIKKVTEEARPTFTIQ